ncbi:hypothetical protein DGo_PE0025 (plasmid) [Deinococcus gobiensis I-0]|uniref:Uncharacterized protein n=1 Tax=Deinococcus gobiensis (strain DSM 21396 / JCM 16679 / CGMCC 1.7299 / I-0) TaxID=745776 RepID=H8H3S2_DEIGI|nr:hypothetical protein DGo_PE0025 [Deinococcus gobiensis I-0]
MFPTGVGMDRFHARQVGPLFCVPHRRGDGPALGGTWDEASKCSPQAWGWTVYEE